MRDSIRDGFQSQLPIQLPTQTNPEISEAIESDNLYDRAYATINNGAMAVLVSGLFCYLAITRGIRSLINSEMGRAILESIKQIRENQKHVEDLVSVTKSVATDSGEMGKVVDTLKLVIEKSQDMDQNRHSELMQAIRTLESLIQDMRRDER